MKAEVSLTAPGEVASASTDSSVQQLFAQGRSLEQRRGEFMADAAVTPQAFVNQSRRLMQANQSRVDRPSSVQITPEDGHAGLPCSLIRSTAAGGRGD